MTKIIDRGGKGAAITEAENDANLSALAGKNQPITATSHTIDVDDQSETIEYLNASAIAVTLPAIATVSGSNIDTDDFTVTLTNIGVGLVTVTRGSADTFANGNTSITLEQYQAVKIQTDNSLTKWNILSRAEGGLVTGSYVSASIVASGEERTVDSIDVTALNTDNFDFGASISTSGAGSLLLRQNSGVNLLSADGRTWSAGLHQPDVFVFDFLALPTTGFLSTIINNTDSSNSIVATVYWWAKAR